MKREYLKTFIIALFLTSCSSISAPAATPTQTKAILTATATLTSVPTPTETSTPIPTPIGGSEPKVAFVGKELQGDYAIYVDGFYTKSPEKIASVSLPEETIPFIQMKWSPDGKKLIFVNGEPTNWSLFLFDTSTGQVREIANVPNRQDAFDLSWSPDSNEVFFITATRSTPLRSWKLDVSSGEIMETKEEHGLSYHISNSINCDPSTFPASLRALSPYRDFVHFVICFNPDANTYYALKANEESTDLVLLTPTGEVDHVLAKFPVDFVTNGYIGLFYSPDQSKALIVGDGGIQITGHQFAYVTDFESAPLDKSDPQLFDESTSSQDFVHVYGWSPDSQDYLTASGYGTAYQIAIVSAATGRPLLQYQIPNSIEPAILIFQRADGIDMVWPSEP